MIPFGGGGEGKEQKGKIQDCSNHVLGEDRPGGKSKEYNLGPMLRLKMALGLGDQK